jgi:MFS family permease
MPTIAGELGGMSLYPWVFSVFLVASTVGVLACGKLADTFGRRPVFAFGMGLFLIGSALCGASTSIEQLIVFRILQGLGAGAIQPIAMTITADLYSLEERARIQGLLTSAWGGANVLGPVIGGFIVLHTSWRWVFLVNVPIGLLAIVLLVIAYRDPPRAERGPTGMTAALLAGIAAALLLVALEPEGSARFVRLALAAAAIAVFVVHERRSQRPLAPASLLASPVVRAGIAGGVFAGAMLYVSAAYVPLWISRSARGDAVAAGMALVPLLVGWAFGSSFGVRILVRYGLRATTVGGFAVALVGAAGLALVVASGLPVRWAFVALGVMGLGIGPAASTSLVAPQSHAPWHQRAVVTSIVYAARMLGGSLAVAVLGAANATTAARCEGLFAIALLAVTTLAVIAPRAVVPAGAAEEAIVPAE